MTSVSLLALLLAQCGAFQPCYEPAGVVNGASFQRGLAPFSFVSIFGTNLAWEERTRTRADAVPGLGGVQVLFNGRPGIVFYASPGQVNALIPGKLLGAVTVQLLRDGRAGPAVVLELAEFAPALFQLDRETAIALRHPSMQPATAEDPARPGEIVLLFLAGLGPLQPALDDYDLPVAARPIQERNLLRVLLNGIAVEDRLIEYAGCAPTYYGLYQINLRLPDRLDPDPEIRVVMGQTVSPAGIRLRTQR